MKVQFKSLAIAFALLISASAFAQNTMTPQEYAKLATAKIDKIVDLSNSQTKKVLVAGEKYGAVLIDVRASNDEVESRRAKITEAKTELEKSLEKILSKGQFAKYKEAASKGGCCKKKSAGASTSGCCKSKAAAGATTGGCCKSKAANVQ